MARKKKTLFNPETHLDDLVALLDQEEPVVGCVDEGMIVAEQRLLVNAVADIAWLLTDKNVSKADLARHLDLSESRVSQIFSGGRGSNITLKTLARIFFVLGETVEVTSPRLKALKGAADSIASRDVSAGPTIEILLRYATQQGKSVFISNDNHGDDTRGAYAMVG